MYHARHTLQVVHQHVPDGNYVAHRAGKDKEVEHRVHVLPLVEAVEHRPGDVCHALGDEPCHGCGAYAAHERPEGDEHRQSHQHEANCLDDAVLAKFAETHNRPGNRREPYKREQRPSPVALLAQRDERYRRVAARNVPVYRGMVPLPEPLLPFRPRAQAVVCRACDV